MIFLFSNASEASSFRISHRALKKNHYLCEKIKKTICKVHEHDKNNIS